MLCRRHGLLCSKAATGAPRQLLGPLVRARSSSRLLTHTASVQCNKRNQASSAAAAPATVLAQQPQDHQSHTDRQPVATKPPRVFKFRHFTLLHGGPCAMMMGTDAMLLGAWAQPPPHTASVLDVGTGSGVLALMMAQKTQQQPQQTSAAVHAIDIDAAAVTQAAANAAASPWAHRVHVALSSLQQWTQGTDIPPLANSSSSHPSDATSSSDSSNGHKYDAIISNPPYFLRSTKPDQTHRAAARHADETLPFSQLARCASQLLAPAGRLLVVLPVAEAKVFEAEAADAGLRITRLTQVYMKSTDKQPKRHLMQFEHAPAASTAAAADAEADADAAGLSATQHGSTPGVTLDNLVVLVPGEPAVAAAGSNGDNSSSSSSRQPTTTWMFSQQYRQLTVDFHHPDLLT